MRICKINFIYILQPIEKNNIRGGFFKTSFLHKLLQQKKGNLPKHIFEKWPKQRKQTCKYPDKKIKNYTC